MRLEDYEAVLLTMLRPGQLLSSAPTSAPKSLAESIKFYKNGATYRVYFFVDNAWRYAALT